MRRVVVTGLGIVSSIGNDKQEVLRSLRESRSGIDFIPEMKELGFRCHVGGRVKGLDISGIPKRVLLSMSNVATFAAVAAAQAIEDAKLPLEALKSDRVAVVVGTTFGGISLPANGSLVRVPVVNETSASAVSANPPFAQDVTSAAVDLTTRKLNWRPDGSYHLLNEAVNKAWDFGRGPAESVSQLRQILALDPKMKLLVGHGLFDLATPYFGSKVILDQLPAYARSDRVKLVVYPGGHMFYSRDATRQAFRAEVEKMMK